jgi:metal-responsive CopG/Arc/MetJ family transcriptional regulator
MAENENANARRRVISVSLTEGHIETLDRLAAQDYRDRSAQLKNLIDEEAARRPAVLKESAAPPQAA